LEIEGILPRNKKLKPCENKFSKARFQHDLHFVMFHICNKILLFIPLFIIFGVKRNIFFKNVTVDILEKIVAAHVVPNATILRGILYVIRRMAHVQMAAKLDTKVPIVTKVFC
jgi:hypothetical protein